VKIRDLKRKHREAVVSVWPPQVLADAGATLVRPGDGVLKGVRRIAKRLSLVIEHRGEKLSAVSNATNHQRWTPSRRCSGRTLMNQSRPIGDLDV